MHNVGGYDSHIIIKTAVAIHSQIGYRKITWIPNSNHKFMTFSNADLKLIGSFQLMLSSLDR